MCLLNIFYLKCILTGMDVSGLSPGYPLTLEPPLQKAMNLFIIRSLMFYLMLNVEKCKNGLWNHGIIHSSSS